MMKTLPSFQGDYEAQSGIKKLPTHKKHAPPVFNMINLSALLVAPIKCTLPLADILRVKLEIWKDVGKCLEKMGIHIPIKCTLPLADIHRVKLEIWKDVGKCLEKMGIHIPISEIEQALKAMKQTKKVVELILVNKVGDYCKGEDGNTTIPMEFVGQTSIAILDSGELS